MRCKTRFDEAMLSYFVARFLFPLGVSVIGIPGRNFRSMLNAMCRNTRSTMCKDYRIITVYSLGLRSKLYEVVCNHS